MSGIVGTLRMGWGALLLKEDAYEKMRGSANPFLTGLVLIVVVGVAVALLGMYFFWYKKLPKENYYEEV